MVLISLLQMLEFSKHASSSREKCTASPHLFLLMLKVVHDADLRFVIRDRIDEKLFDQSIRVNVNGTFYTCQAAARQMKKQGRGGSIIGISSISALQGGGLQVHYTPTKAAVLSMIQSMAIALAKDNIRCNALLPGTIHTQLADADMANDVKRKYLEHRIPMGRVGRPEDLAGPAVFLGCEQMSGFMTGSQMLVDGGMYVHLQ